MILPASPVLHCLSSDPLASGLFRLAGGTAHTPLCWALGLPVHPEEL